MSDWTCKPAAIANIRPFYVIMQRLETAEGDLRWGLAHVYLFIPDTSSCCRPANKRVFETKQNHKQREAPPTSGDPRETQQLGSIPFKNNMLSRGIDPMRFACFRWIWSLLGKEKRIGSSQAMFPMRKTILSFRTGSISSKNMELTLGYLVSS